MLLPYFMYDEVKKKKSLRIAGPEENSLASMQSSSWVLPFVVYSCG